MIYSFLPFEFSVIKENSCGSFSLWPWIYSVGSHFALFFMYSRNLQLGKKWLFWWSVNLKLLCLQSLAPVSYQLIPVSTWVSYGWLAAKECLWFCFLWLNFLIPLIIEILPSFIAWSSMNQSLWQNSEYRQIHMWAIVHDFFYCSSEWYVAGR